MPKKKTSILKFLIIFVFLSLIFIAIYSYFWWQSSQKPVSLVTTEKEKIIIPKGYGSIAIGKLLAEKGFIRSSFAFRILVDRKNYSDKLQAGSYDLSPSQSLTEIIETLTKGSTDFWLTIPEGKRKEEIAQIIAKAYSEKNLNFSISNFIEASENLEGYLFPDTYLIPETMTEEGIVNLLRTTFDQKIPDAEKIKAADLNLDFQAVLILASLIEREAKFAVDRPQIAGVLLNRLSISMPLQIDATVQYAIASDNCTVDNIDCNWWPKTIDTSFKSSYNTYLIPNLPPSPICNPGFAAIAAVLNPSQNNYLYYLSEDSGKTHYSETLEEHNQKIEKYLR